MERAGGDVHQITGDELMVVFGGKEDEPDHAAKAARAGLLLQRAAQRIAEGHDDWPRFRVGVNSGEVLAGVVGAATGHRKHGIVGDVVNLAARLQAEAPVGGVVIGESTFRQLEGRTVAEALPPRRVKGKEEPVAAYVLHEIGRAPAIGD